MSNKNVFWIKVKNSSTVSNIFSSTILGQLRKESIYDYGKTNSFVFNKFFDDKKSFWVEAKDHQDIIELIEILSQEFSTPILALWNKKYIAYNSIGRRIEIESEFEKDYCLVASILEESTGYSFDADKFFEDEDNNSDSCDFDEDENSDNEEDDENDDEFDEDEEEYYFDEDDSYDKDLDDETSQELNDNDVNEYSFDEEEKEIKKPCGKDCRCVPYDEYYAENVNDDDFDFEDKLEDNEYSCDQDSSCGEYDELNTIDEIKKETMYHTEKVIELCDEILNSKKISKNKDSFESSCMCNDELDNSVEIENDEYVCNGSCSKNIDDFGFFFEETDLDSETSDNTLFNVEVDVNENNTFEVKDEKEESKNNEEDFNSKIEEEKKNFESTFFELDKKENKDEEKYDFIVETIENLDNFLNDKVSTEINIDFDLDKEIENESFDDEEHSLASENKIFDEHSEKGFNDFFVIEEEDTEKKSNEVNFEDKKKSFDVNLESDEKILEDFFSIINDNNQTENQENSSFEAQTIKNLTLEEDNFDDIHGSENILDDVFESLEDKKENNELLNNLFSNNEVDSKTNEIDLNELLKVKEENNIDTLNENKNLLNSLFSEDENQIDNKEEINLSDLLVKKDENTTINEFNLDHANELVEEIIDNDALFEKNESFEVDNEKDYLFKSNESIDFDLINSDESNVEQIVLANSKDDHIDEKNNFVDEFEQIEKVEDSMYEIYQENANSYFHDSIVNLHQNESQNFEHNNIVDDNEVVVFDEDNLNIEEEIFNATNELLNETNEHVVEEKNKTLYDMVLDSEESEKEVNKMFEELENNISESNEETSSNLYKDIHEKNKKVSDELNIFLNELKKEKDLINNREEVILKREKKLKEIMNSDYAKNINIDSSNRKWRVIR